LQGTWTKNIYTANIKEKNMEGSMLKKFDSFLENKQIATWPLSIRHPWTIPTLRGGQMLIAEIKEGCSYTKYVCEGIWDIWTIHDLFLRNIIDSFCWYVGKFVDAKNVPTGA
jgi:hypothetical protein